MRSAPPLHDVLVDVILDEDTVISDRRRWRTGFRTIDVRNWIWQVNGEQLFVKGASIGPARPDLGVASPSELAADLRDARGAGLDLVRVHTHISRRELYEAADELGMLVWQDLPLHRRYARSVRKQAVRQAREAVDFSPTTRRSRCGAATTSRIKSTRPSHRPQRSRATAGGPSGRC